MTTQSGRGRRFLDFDVLIEFTGGAHFVRVLASPAGESSARFKVPFSDVELENVILRLTRLSASSARRETRLDEIGWGFGGKLFNALFDGETRSRWAISQDEAARQGSGLRLRLRLGDDSGLANVPWELLYDSVRGEFLALSRQTPLIRYVELASSVRPLSTDLPLSALVILADPSDTPAFDLERHWLKLRHASGEVFTIERLGSPTLRALQQKLRQGRYNILHFVGHGAWDGRKGGLLFEDDSGRASVVDASHLGVLLADHDPLRLVVLDASEGDRTSSTDPFAQIARSLVTRAVPAVIATQFEISDAAGFALWRELYRALADGFAVDEALAEARKAVYATMSSLEWAAPALYTRVPDARIFDIRQPAAVVAPTGVSIVPEVATPVAPPSISPASTEVEDDILRMGTCATVEEIAVVHRSLIVPEQGDQLSSLLGSFATASRDVEVALAQESAYTQREALRRVEGRLDDLAGRLSRNVEWRTSDGSLTTDSRYAALLGPVQSNWRAIVARRIGTLAETVERLQEIDSPYIVGTPLSEQEQIFIGRSSISARIEHMLLDRRSPSLLLYGQRRMGKTSLLYNLGRLLPSTIVPLFVDLQGPATQADSHAGLLFHLAAAMAASAKRQRDLNVLAPPRESFSADPFTRFYEWLDDFDAAIERRTALLMLDEFEVLDRAFRIGKFDGDDVLGMLRHLIQHRTRFKVLLAGSHTLTEFERWASFLINVQVVKVGYLTETEARQLVERPVSDFALRYDDDASRRVLSLTHRHPFLLQLLCAEIVALKNEQAPAVRRRATRADVDDAVPRALQSGALFFSDIERNQVDATSLALLRRISEEPEGAAASRSDLREAYGGDLDGALQALLEREIIEETDGAFRVQVELIRRWLAR